MVYSEPASIPLLSSFSAFSIGELFLFLKPCALNKEMCTPSYYMREVTEMVKQCCIIKTSHLSETFNFT